MIVLRHNGELIGMVDFALDDREDGTGHALVDIMDEAVLERLNEHLDSNPTDIRIMGGHSTTSLRPFPEGVAQAVQALTEEFEGVTAEGQLDAQWTPPTDRVY